MEDRPSGTQAAATPVNPGVNPETGLIDRIPSDQELGIVYGEKARAMHDAEAQATTPEDTSPILYSPTSVGHPGPNSPWGPTVFTGNYRRIADSDDLMVQVATGHDDADPMMANSKASWVPLSQIRSGSVTWRTSDFPGGGRVELAS